MPRCLRCNRIADDCRSASVTPSAPVCRRGSTIKRQARSATALRPCSTGACVDSSEELGQPEELPIQVSVSQRCFPRRDPVPTSGKPVISDPVARRGPCRPDNGADYER
jgi:hypothetical protein